MNKPDDVTRLIAAWQSGDGDALEKLAPYIYEELHRIAASYMRRENSGNTLQTTALVSEAYLNLAGSKAEFADRKHFFALAARMMRRILVDHARSKRAAKRGGGLRHLTFDEAAIVVQPDDTVIEVDEALTRLESFDEQLARAVELRYFGGMSLADAAAALGISVTTLHEDLKLAQAWLRRELSA